MKFKIRLDTNTDAVRLATIAGHPDFANERITVTDGNGLRANAKSVLGTLSAMEYNDLWLETEHDHFFVFREFIVEE